MNQASFTVGRMVLVNLCLLVGTVPTHLLYAMSEDGNILNVGLFVMILVAAVISFSTFSYLRIHLGIGPLSTISGFIGSYFVLFALLFMLSLFSGGGAEFVMWLPIVALFGIPYAFPVIGMACLASIVAIPGANEESAVSIADQ